MTCINDYIFVTYIEPDMKGIFIPRVWDELDEYGFKTGLRTENNDRKAVNPQICYVLAENPHYPQYSIGTKLFTHYLEYEAPEMIVGTTVGKMIQGGSVFFMIGGDNEILPAENTYIGKRIIDEPPRSVSGIYLTPNQPTKRKSNIELTHLPDSSKYSVGDIILTVDDNQYDLIFEGAKYVKVYDEEIVGLMADFERGIRESSAA